MNTSGELTDLDDAGKQMLEQMKVNEWFIIISFAFKSNGLPRSAILLCWSQCCQQVLKRYENSAKCHGAFVNIRTFLLNFFFPSFFCYEVSLWQTFPFFLDNYFHFYGSKSSEKQFEKFLFGDFSFKDKFFMVKRCFKSSYQKLLKRDCSTEHLAASRRNISDSHIVSKSIKDFSLSCMLLPPILFKPDKRVKLSLIT